MPRRDLTQGEIVGCVLSLAVPTIASNLLRSAQTLVDMFFVGRLGPEALAAVGMGGTAVMVLVTLFMGVHVATAAMVARAVGAGDSERASHVATQALLLSAIVAVALGLAGYYGAAHFLRALGAKPEVVALGTGYMRILFVGIIFTGASFITAGALHGAGDAITPFYLGLLTTVCNVILTPVMIHGYLGFPALGVRGSALATVVSQFVAFAVALGLLLSGRLRVRLRVRAMKPDPAVMWRVLAIGAPSSMRMGVRMVMNLALMAIVAQFGTLLVAAYTVGLRVRMIGLLPSFGFGVASATMVGQNLGANRPDRSARSGWTAALMALGVSGLSAGAFAVFAPAVVSFFNQDPAVVEAGAHMLRVTAVGLASAAVGIVLNRSIAGAGDTVSPLIISLVVLWGLQIPAAVYLSGTRQMWGLTVPFVDLFRSVVTRSATGIWYAMVGASLVHAVVTAVWFAMGRWKLKAV